MAKKRKVTKKKPKKAAVRRLPKSRAKTSAPKRSKPASKKSNSRAAKFESFDEAKSAAIDSLIEVIEEAERRLWAVKAARSQAELSTACQSRGKGAK